MLVILKKIFYILLILVINLHICSYINSKFVSRMELRRGPKIAKVGVISYPASRFFEYLSRDCKISIWEVLIFIVSFLIWSVTPITSRLVLIDVDFSLLPSLFFYILFLMLNFLNGSRTSYKFIFSAVTRKNGMLLSFFIPVLFSVSSVVLVSKTLSIKNIINSQYQHWNIVYQPLGFIIIFIAVLFQFKILGISKKNIFLFVENINKEGGGLGKAITRLSDYIGAFFLIVLLISLYLGGWQRIYFIKEEVMLALKFYIIFILVLLIDKATPKLNDYRYLFSINWGFLVPLSVVNFTLTLGFLIYRNVFNFI